MAEDALRARIAELLATAKARDGHIRMQEKQLVALLVSWALIFSAMAAQSFALAAA